MNLAAVSRQALARAKKARLIHCPSVAYYGNHLAILTTDAHGQPAFMTRNDGSVLLVESVPEAEAILRELVPDLPLEIDDFCLRPPGWVMP